MCAQMFRASRIMQVATRFKVQPVKLSTTSSMKNLGMYTRDLTHTSQLASCKRCYVDMHCDTDRCIFAPLFCICLRWKHNLFRGPLEKGWVKRMYVACSYKFYSLIVWIRCFHDLPRENPYSMFFWDWMKLELLRPWSCSCIWISWPGYWCPLAGCDCPDWCYWVLAGLQNSASRTVMKTCSLYTPRCLTQSTAFCIGSHQQFPPHQWDL
jgi:hypothetical protein